MAENKGYILLYRSILDNPLYRLEKFTKIQAWIDILILTCFTENYITTKNGQVIKLERGQCGYSVVALADRWMWSRTKVKRFLELLENEKMIQQKNVSNHNIINVLNYDKYQNGAINDTINVQQTSSKRYNKRTQINNDKERILMKNNDKKKKGFV